LKTDRDLLSELSYLPSTPRRFFFCLPHRHCRNPISLIGPTPSQLVQRSLRGGCWRLAQTGCLCIGRSSRH
jgi:hypothetical protein